MQLRAEHPGWGPRTIVRELAREAVAPLPSYSSIYRRLVRHRLIEPQKRRRKREEHRRGERARDLGIITGIDDHSRFCVCALTPRVTARSVCEALRAAMQRHGTPEQFLTDNGKVFTARFGRGSGEVLFGRLCRESRGLCLHVAIQRSPSARVPPEEALARSWEVDRRTGSGSPHGLPACRRDQSVLLDNGRR